MAGAGYKLFATGDVLTAAQVNTYLMQQTVMVFASSAARTSALSGVLAEGMVSYLQDSNTLEVYDGAAWVGATGDITGLTAGTGISISSATGPVPTITNSMATEITAKGDLIVGTGSGTFDNLAVSSQNGDTIVADSSTSTGLRYQSNFAAGKNKIINGDFGIWQRGTSFASGTSSQYLADRFYYERSTGTYSASRQTFTPGTAPVAGYEGQYFLRVSPTVAGDMRIAQYVENVQTFAGQTVTFSFWAKASTATTIQYVLYSQNFGSGGSGTANNTTGASQAITTSWARYSFTVTMDSIAGKTIGTSSYVRFAIDLAETFTGDFDTWGWQLEAGSVATAFQTATGTIQGELAACQRYYEQILWNIDTFRPAVVWQASSAAVTYLPFLVQKRSTPTISFGGNGGYRYVSNNGVNAGLTITTGTISTQGTSISTTATWTLVGAGWIDGNGSSGYFVAASAEL